MKKYLLIICLILVFVIGGLSGCVENIFKEGTGTIKYNDFEGGFFGIIADDGFGPFDKLDPINLPGEYAEDGLRVRFKVRILFSQLSFHMWGLLVKILEIEKIYY